MVVFMGFDDNGEIVVAEGGENFLGEIRVVFPFFEAAIAADVDAAAAIGAADFDDSFANRLLFLGTGLRLGRQDKKEGEELRYIN